MITHTNTLYSHVTLRWWSFILTHYIHMWLHGDGVRVKEMTEKSYHWRRWFFLALIPPTLSRCWSLCGHSTFSLLIFTRLIIFHLTACFAFISVYLPPSLSLSLPLSLPLSLSTYLPIYLSISISLHPSSHLLISLSPTFTNRFTHFLLS